MKPMYKFTHISESYACVLYVFILSSGQSKNFRRALGTFLTPKRSSQYSISICKKRQKKSGF